MEFNLIKNNVFTQKGYNIKIDTQGVDLETYFGKNPIMLFNHDKDKVIGKWNNVSIDENGVVKGTPEFSEDEFSKDKENKVKNNHINSVSPALEIKETSYDTENEVFSIDKSVLLEVSIVSVPANPETRVENEKDGILFFSNGETENIENLINNKKSTIMSENKENFEDMKAKKLELESKVENFEKESNNLKETIQNKDSELEAKNNEIKELQDKIEEYKKEKMENLIDAAIQEGKISENAKEEFMELSYEKAENILSKLNVTNNVSLKKEIEGEDNNNENSDDKEVTYEYLLENKMLNDYKMKHPQHFEKLKKEYFNKIEKGE